MSELQINFFHHCPVTVTKITETILNCAEIFFYFVIIYNYLSSSCRAASTDILAPLSPLFLIIHRLWKVFRATSRISSYSCCMYVQVGCPAFAWPHARVHRSTSLMSSSLLLQQCPACLVHLTCFHDGRQVAVLLVPCGVLPPGLVQYCSQHSCVIAI